MCLAGVVGARNNSNEFFRSAGEKDFADRLLRRAWTIHAVVLLASFVAGAVPRSCGLAGGLLLPGTLHGHLDLGLLAALSGWLIECLTNLWPAEQLGFFSLRQLAGA